MMCTMNAITMTFHVTTLHKQRMPKNKNPRIHPPKNPSIVLLGEMDGASGRFP